MDTKICSSSKKRPRKRKSHTRKIPLEGILNMAEARREIVNALHLHRSNSTTGTITSRPLRSSSQQQYYYPLMDESSIRVAEPTWSTTAPSVVAAAAVPPGGDQMVEFEWPENVSSSSYAWWSSFLNSLDGKNKNNSFRENVSVVYGEECCPEHGGNHDFEGSFLDFNDLDEWLVVPTAEDSCNEMF